MIYKEQKFNIPKLNKISDRQIKTHLELYAGYIKHTNLIREKIHELENTNKEKNLYVIKELRRRFSFEFNGMRMHEYYFEQFEDRANAISQDSKLLKALSKRYGLWNGFINHFKETANIRGVGWAVVYWDAKARTPHTAWVSSHELGALVGLPILFVIDMWEHAFMVDYLPSQREEYIDAFLNNINWNIIEERFNKAI